MLRVGGRIRTAFTDLHLEQRLSLIKNGKNWLMADKQESKWLPAFMKFIDFLRIDSKEVAAQDSRGSKLEIWESQRIFLKELCEGLDRGVRTFYVLKARQLGISTISLVIDIWWLAIHEGTIGALVTDTEANREAFRSTIKRYIDSFPKGFFGKGFTILKDNRNFMQFSNGSRLDFLVAGTRNKKTWGEGKGYSFAHLTEVANYGSKEGLDSFREALAEKHPNRLFIYESTAKGHNFWKEMYEDAGRDKLTKKRMFIGFWAKEINRIEKSDPRFLIYGTAEPDEEERELIKVTKERHNFDVPIEALAFYRWRQSDSSTDLNTIKQNLPWYDAQSFILSGYSFFQVRVLQKELSRIMDGTENEPPVPFRGYRMWLGNDFWASKMEPITTMDRIDEVELRVWEEPKGGVYAIGCDPALGRNDWKDRHAINVYRCFADRIVQVAEYADNNVETRQAAWVLAYLAGIYENCIVNIELTGGHGRAVMTEFDHLRERMKAEIYQNAGGRDWEDFLSNARHYLYKKADQYGGGSVKGFDTNSRTKVEVMNQLRDSHSSGAMIINSGPLINEMLTVVQDGYEIGAPGRAKDDRVFSSALANRVWIDHFRMTLTSQGLTYNNYLLDQSDEGSAGNAVVDNIVLNFFKNAEEREEEVTPQQAWMQERGFV